MAARHVTIPCYNEETSIGGDDREPPGPPLSRRPAADPDHLGCLDRPDRRDRAPATPTAGWNSSGCPYAAGKTAAENAAAPLVRGDIVVNTDATIRIEPGSLKALVRAFQDPTVGVASGRDISVGGVQDAANQGESGYVGYEMWVRRLETRVG